MIFASEIADSSSYARVREQRLRALAEHKAARRVELGQYISLLFESRETVLGQIQEVVHVEAKRDAAQIRGEIDEYLCLLPKPGLLTATLMVHAGGAAIGAAIGSELFARLGVVTLEIGPWECPCHSLSPTDPGLASAVHYIGFSVPDPAVVALRRGVSARLRLRSSVERVSLPIAAPLRAVLIDTLSLDPASDRITAPAGSVAASH